MIQAEPEVFESLERGADAISLAVNRRTGQLQSSARMFSGDLTLGTVAALLFAAGYDDNVGFPGNYRPNALQLLLSVGLRYGGRRSWQTRSAARPSSANGSVEVRGGGRTKV